VTFVTGDWYEISATFQSNGGGGIAASGYVQDHGTSGSFSGTVYTFQGTIIGAVDISADTAVYPAFRAFKGNGSDTVDNMTVRVVPEASVSALASVGAILLFGVTRRATRAA
jgi:hypothetical protein